MDQTGLGRWWWPLGCAVVSLLLFMGSWLVPLAGTLASAATPVPLAWLYRGRGPAAGRLGLGLAVVGAWLLTVFLDLGVGWVYYLFYVILALGLGESWNRRLPDSWAVGLAALGGAAALLVVALAGSLSGEQEIGQAWQAYWQTEVDTALKLYRESGAVDPEQLGDARQVLLSAGSWLLHLAPGILGAGALLLAWANQLIVRALEARRQPSAPRQSLTTWRSPEPLVWLVIVAGAVAWAAEGGLYWASVNLLVILGVIYFFQGMAVIAFWFEKKNAPRFLRVGLYLLIVVEAFLAVGVALAGLFDIWFNFRRLESNPPA